ncbi:MAG: tetratricopeptide repeat protein [Bacteroidetes bacterium]|nr:tetratricopeptide repeat protein [Bacteroidota bacterium]MBT4730172.1 tetratricopeptide repeat protein [Bacteroidota bacterium]MBT6836298.1 tetratricopeptide repeat protein [Bacteroidota bacterium]MBT7038633.1 tetratricopeptide repeat protein [Bacteroidota bacterium]
MNKLILTILLSAITVLSFGQNEHKMTRKGNKLYTKNQFTDAEANYKKALEIDQKHEQASFNLGDSYFEQGRYDEAITQFTISANTTDDNHLKNRAYYNLGNSNLEAFKSIKESSNQEEMQKKSQYLDQSIEAYKEALKVEPTDMESKYNLSYALKNKPKGEGQNNQQNQDQDKKEDQEKQDQKEENKDKKDEQKKDQQQQEKDDKKGEDKEKQQQPKPDEQKMTKKEAEKLLKAQEQNEKDVQAKIIKQKAKPVKVKIEKEW